MANTFLTPSVIAARALPTLYNTMVLAGLVYRDYDNDFRNKQGATITVRKPAVFTAGTFDRANGITLQAATETSATLTLDTIPDMAVTVTDEEMTLSIDAFGERILTPMMEAIAQKVDGEIAEKLVDAAEGAGGGGTVSMVSSIPMSVFTQLVAAFGRNKMPSMGRYAVLSPEAHATMLGSDQIVAVDKAGATDALREAVIGRIFGFETYGSIQAFGLGAGDKGQADGVAFHRDAVVLAMRPLQTPMGLAPNQSATQNYKGLALRVVYAYDVNKKQDTISVDTLYGIGTLRPVGAVQMSFGLGS